MLLAFRVHEDSWHILSLFVFRMRAIDPLSPFTRGCHCPSAICTAVLSLCRAPTLETEAFIAPSSLLCAPPDAYGRLITGYFPLSKTLRPMASRALEARQQTEHSCERHLQFCRLLLFFPELRTKPRALRYHRAKSPTTGFIFLTPFFSIRNPHLLWNSKAYAFWSRGQLQF